MFTRPYLKSLATATVFGRGEDYFLAGNVGKITREGNTFTAKVRGSYAYKVKLTLRPAGAKLRCNCPYEFEGICKHQVALGLAVLKKFGSQLQVDAEPLATLDTSPLDLEEALRDTRADVQLAFLATLLRQNAELRRQFLQHVVPASEAVAAALAIPVPVYHRQHQHRSIRGAIGPGIR